MSLRVKQTLNAQLRHISPRNRTCCPGQQLVIHIHNDLALIPWLVSKTTCQKRGQPKRCKASSQHDKGKKRVQERIGDLKWYLKTHQDE